MNFLDFKENFSTANTSFYKVGGVCKYYFQSDNHESLNEAQELAVKLGIDSVLVEDSNYIVSTAGYNGLLIQKNNDAQSKGNLVFKSIPFSDAIIEKLKEKGVTVDVLLKERKSIDCGLLINEIDFTGKDFGGFMISNINPNVIDKINNSATVDEFMQLVSYIKQQIRDKFFVQLEEAFIFIS